jgi:hypothetical protein
MLTSLENLVGPAALVFVGVIISGIGAFWASQQQARQSDDNAKLNMKMAAQQEQLNTKSDEILKLNQHIAAQQEQTNTTLTKILNGYVVQGKITKEEAQEIRKAVVQATLDVTLGDVKAEIKGEVKPLQPK